jgi:hypothetical protein
VGAVDADGPVEDVSGWGSARPRFGCLDLGHKFGFDTGERGGGD